MKKNVGKTDRILRVIEALIFITLFIFNTATGIWSMIFIVLAAMLLVTSYMSWCPLYIPFRINTIKKVKAV